MRLSSRFRLIRYDERATGLSDWNVDDISFDAFVHDLETVVDTLGLERFALLGMSQGAAVSVAYATRHPERVSRLVLCGGYVLGHRKRADALEVAQREALEQLVRLGWGQDNPAFRQVFTSLFIPGGTHEQMQWFNESAAHLDLAGQCGAAAGAASAISTCRNLLSQVRVPTLVLHARNDARVPFDQGLTAGARNTGRAFRRTRQRQSRRAVARAGMGTLLSEVAGFLAQDGENFAAMCRRLRPASSRAGPHARSGPASCCANSVRRPRPRIVRFRNDPYNAGSGLCGVAVLAERTNRTAALNDFR